MKQNRVFRYLSCMGIFLMMSGMISVTGNANEQTLVEKAKHPLSEISSFAKRPIPKQWNGKEQKVIYLTFDDGPTKLTDSILSILDKYNVPATFFFIGTKVNQYSDQVKAVHEAGHYIGLHSMSHDKKVIYNPQQPHALSEELIQEQNLLESLIGVRPNLVRPPYGSVPGMTLQISDSLVDNGFKVWDWTIDSEDWRNKTTLGIIDKIKSQTSAPMEVVLVHEKELTVEALSQIIEFFLEKGYEFRAYSPENHFSVNFVKDPRL